VVVDVLLVGALGLLAPPLVAFAVWFGGWHSLRHCTRLLTVEPRSAGLLAVGRPGAAVRALARLALWPTLAAVAALVALLVATAAAADPAQAVGGTLLVLLALTVPHMLVVLGLDRRESPDALAPPGR
jgi:Brp/Blh family beta-carotene 15,15'-monooxygenase